MTYYVYKLNIHEEISYYTYLSMCITILFVHILNYIRYDIRSYIFS